MLQPERTETNIRFYSDEQLKKILNIALLSRNGYKISKISKLDNQEIFSFVKEICEDGDLASNIENAINSLLLATVELNEAKFEKLFNSFIASWGLEETISSFIFPFLERVGLLWGIDEMNVVQEHFASHLIRQKLEVAISNIVAKESEKTFILFLPEGELHELGLLYAYFLLKKKGKRVIYLGQNVPFNAVADALDIVKNPVLLSLLITTIDSSQFNHMIETLESQLPENGEICLGGNPDVLMNLSSNSTKTKICYSISDFVQKYNLA